MAPSTFHKFPELPPEIQLQVWESSFRSPKAIPGGLHYIGLDHGGFPVPLDKTAKDEFQRARSGYELEQGLWTACWDSRAAAMKHQLQQDAESSYSDVLNPTTLEFALRGRESYAGREPVSIIPPIDEGQEQKMVIYPSQDIFCVALNRAGRAACCGNYYPLRKFKRLAFEFKPSWNIQLSQHDNYYPIKKFLPSLAFMLRLVFEAAHTRHFTTPTIRLIDRNARWINDDTTQLGLDTFYDRDHKYVEISMKPGSSSAQILCHSPVLEFFDHLDRLLEDKLSKLQNLSSSHLYHMPKFVLRDYFSIITLRQNEAGAAKE
ncbi:hypothetical protein NOF04DRAFT_6757 [Fusarium oxysporum II5]|uniref:2EXR domain-containing protein n=3 Tax=Fusarium oxysporum species complex TaxID=171631 RepID=N1S2P4_FUSC4|nr:uncharacterized protein FOIG_09897 [Fusarium odoratissimum NRRL 54006]EMT71896.1 hypothetical protein FOC4_g10003739 [Fusarium odoratissimum]EXL98347.1 hypothetical protein FOIG_09897 [Fusarium odoratissimum NRRL 54006]KAK2123983.1 hypothetical protein NOF04DRAFT_6757 [Fusarium oxysporum II5]TXB95951.1 hypothetical protein FocTR4_00016433 [Fusarium oxysporum f. sp. cubense]